MWQTIPNEPDLQCWQTANPRANHTLRILLPAMSADHVLAHDEGLWETARALLGEIPHEDAPHARDIATLPMMRGLWLGVCSPLCTSCPLGFMGQCNAHYRNEESHSLVETMSSHDKPVEECVGDLRREVGQRRTKKANLESGDTDGNVGLFSISDSYVRKGTMLSAQLLDGRIFGQHSGRNAGAAFGHCPQVLSSPSRRACSGHCFWSGHHCHCR